MERRSVLIQVIRDPSWSKGYAALAKTHAVLDDQSGFEMQLRRSIALDPLHPAVRELSIIGAVHRGWSSHRNFERELYRCLIADPSSLFGLWQGLVYLKFSERLLPLAQRLTRRALCAHPADSRIKEQAWKLKSDWGWNDRGVVGNFVVDDGAKEDIPRFFRTAHARFFPRHLQQVDDLDRTLHDDIFHGYLPEAPQIASDRPIVAMGSCFAQHIRQHLLRHGRQSSHVPVPEGLNNTFAIRQFVDWAGGGAEALYSYERTDGNRMERWEADKDRGAFRQAISQAGGFVVTVGVAEVWQDKRTGGVFWRGIPQDIFDPQVHEHRLSTVEENTDNLRAIARALRGLAGDVPVVFTLSPVPLIATMRERTSIFAADAVSKSTLRLAIEHVMLEREDGVHYWPSFEAFRWLGAHQERRLYDGENNPRHPSTDMIARMVDLFVRSFIAGSPGA